MVNYLELAEKYTSPLYIFDKDAALKRVSDIKNRLPNNAKLCYAIKANAFLLNVLKNEDILFEVCSSGELSICEEDKILPEKIIFSGVLKTFEDVKRAYNLSVNTITLESLTHLSHLEKVLQTEKNHPQDIIIRLNKGNQFGMSEEDVYECVERLKKFSSINIRGIHFFTGTQKKIKKITEEIDFIENFCDELKTKTGINFSSIEYGPGLSFDYFASENEAENFTELEAFSELIKNSKYNYVIELGRYVASPCGTYVTQIMDLKSDKDIHYIIIDGGINHINYYGQMMGMKNPPVEHVKRNPCEGKNDFYTIAGSLCTTADIVLRKLELNSPANGDLLVFKNIGAYSITEGIYLFLSHALPCVLLKSGNEFTVLRKPYETYILNR